MANDPDADRLGVAIPITGDSSGEWRLLRGDEIGWLLGDHILRHTHGDDRLVVTTLVSSSLLGKMAHKHGVAFEETFTGFKWIADAAMKRSDKRLVFAYEQALGYLVADQPLDKDGISAALVALIFCAAARISAQVFGRSVVESPAFSKASRLIQSTAEDELCGMETMRPCVSE